MSQDVTENLQKVLIADDNVHIMNLMRKFFAKAKQKGDLICDVLEVSDGRQAIKVLEEHKPDLILCDINMPNLSGYGVLKYFNNTHVINQPYCFFTFLTSSADELQNAFAQNVKGFLDKNEMNYFVLSNQIGTWLRLAKLERMQEKKSTDKKEEPKKEKPMNKIKKETSKESGETSIGFFSKNQS